jgi:hypothetical protein
MAVGDVPRVHDDRRLLGVRHVHAQIVGHDQSR